MLLSQILSGVPTAEGEWPDIEISTVEIDSRKVMPGALFIAVNGNSSDGRKYIPDAVAKGAAAVLYDGGNGFDGFCESARRYAGKRCSCRGQFL